KAAGAALVGLAFVLPSFLMVIAIAVAYLRFGGLPWMRGAFYGIGAAVIAIIARSAVKLTRLTLAADRLLWAIFGVAALVTAWTESEVIWIFIGYLVAGFAGALVAALATFLPCYLFTVIPAPHLRRLSQNRSLKAFVDGVTAAATGAIAGAAFVLGRRALVDVTTLAIALGA